MEVFISLKRCQAAAATFIFLCLFLPQGQPAFCEPLETVAIQLSGPHGFEFAGYYAAKEKGFYAEEGLDVVFREGEPGRNSVQAALDGEAEYGVSDASLVLDRLRGKPAVLLLQVFQRSPRILLTLKDSGLADPSDLGGKKIALDIDGGTDAPLLALLMDAVGGLDKFTAKPSAPDATGLVSGDVDALAASLLDQPFLLEKGGVSVNAINPQQYGVDFYGDNLFTTEKEIDERPERARKMAGATLKGWRYALRRRDEIAGIIQEKYNPLLGSEQLSYEARMVEMTILPELIPLGSVDERRCKEIADVFVRAGLAKPGYDLKGFFAEASAAAVQDSGALSEAGFQLTPEEKAWLDARTEIRVGAMDAWPPLDFVDESGAPAGIGVDFLAALNEQLGGKLVIVSAPFNENFEKVKNLQLDALLDITPKPEREPFFNFTRPYMNIPHAIVGRKDGPEFKTEKELIGKTVGLERGFYDINYFQENYPDVSIKEYGSTSEALDAVSRGEVDAYAGNRAVAAYLIEKELLANLKVTGRMEKLSVVLAVGVRKDWPELAALLDRALASISRGRERQILQKWAEATEPEKSAFHLKPKEEAWLKEHPQIRVGSMEAWPPMDFVDEYGTPRGIGADFVEALNERLGGRLILAPGPWDSIYEQVKERKLDALLGITPREDRRPHFNFTKPYANIPHVIVALKGGAYFDSLASLEGKTAAIEKGFFLVQYLKENHPGVRVAEYGSTSDALDAVSKGEADAYVGNRAAAAYVMEKELLNDLRIQGKVRATASVNSIGVRNDWPELTAILDRALASLTPEEIRAIYSRWGGIGRNEAMSLAWISLSPEEKAWLNERPVIRVAGATDWDPVEYADENGEFKGISADYLQRISKVLGVEFQFKKGVDWRKAMELLQKKELDIFSAASETPSQKAYARFTRPYLTLPTAIFTRDDVTYVKDLGELAGRKVAAVKGFAITEHLKRERPEIEVIEAQSPLDGLKMVQSREVYAYVGSILVTSQYIRKAGYSNIKVSGETGFKYEIAMAARSDWPMLTRLLQKALDSIDEEDSNSIFRKWIAVTYEKRVDYSLLWKVALGALALILLVSFWNRRLSSEVRERIRAEKSLKQRTDELGAANERLKELDRLKSLFIASMSHELRTPLNSIIGFTGILLMGLTGDLNDEQRKQLNMVKSSATHLLALITDIIDISKIEAGKVEFAIEEFDLAALVREALDSFAIAAADADLSISLDESPEELVIQSDRRRIREVVMNFVSNAVKYSDKGKIRVKVTKKGDLAQVSVQDEGIGIKQEDLGGLFQTFNRIYTEGRVKEGTGLGLYLSKKIANLLGGEVWAESEFGGGSEFFFTTPVKYEPRQIDETDFDH